MTYDEVCIGSMQCGIVGSFNPVVAETITKERLIRMQQVTGTKEQLNALPEILFVHCGYVRGQKYILSIFATAEASEKAFEDLLLFYYAACENAIQYKREGHL